MILWVGSLFWAELEILLYMVSAVLTYIGISLAVVQGLFGSGQAHSHGSGFSWEIWTFFSTCGVSLHMYLILKLLSLGLVTGDLVPRVNVQASSPLEAKSKKPHSVTMPIMLVKAIHSTIPDSRGG